jgi:tetratricopeptide (TPR) repeat protein
VLAKTDNRRPRLPGLDIRPGSVREARSAAGLSLAAIAGQDLSRTAIHLIETGRSRPSLRTLQLIAERTGKPLSFFGVGAPKTEQSQRDPRIGDLEALYLGERFDAARKLAEAILADAHGEQDRAQAAFELGRIEFRLNHGDAALTSLRAALSGFTASGDAWMVVETKLWLAKTLFVLESPEALALAQEALHECRQLQPVPIATEVKLLENIAAIQVARHEWQDAIHSYETAIEAAGSLRDLSDLRQMYDNLSIAYQEIGNFDRAAECSRKALALWEVDRDRLALARLENNYGMVLLKQGRLGSAQEHLTKALQLCDELHVEYGRAHVLLSLGELAMSRHADDEAAAHFSEALGIAAGLGERVSEGRVATGADVQGLSHHPSGDTLSS